MYDSLTINVTPEKLEGLTHGLITKVSVQELFNSTENKYISAEENENTVGGRYHHEK